MCVVFITILIDANAKLDGFHESTQFPYFNVSRRLFYFANKFVWHQLSLLLTASAT